MIRFLDEGGKKRSSSPTTPSSIAIGEFREMKMQPALERALRHKGL